MYRKNTKNIPNKLDLLLNDRYLFNIILRLIKQINFYFGVRNSGWSLY